MRNRILPLILTTFAAAVLLLTTTARASDLTCRSMNTSWWGEPTARAQESGTVAATSSPLHVTAARNGGIQVSGWGWRSLRGSGMQDGCW